MNGAWKNFVLPTSLLTGTIIGAGIFSLPYVFHRIGIVASVVYMGVFCIVLTLMHLMYADIVAASRERHRFAGFARNLLGTRWYIPAIIVGVMQLFLVLTIYLVLAPSFIRLFLPALGVGWAALAFWVAGTAVIFVSSRRLALAEFVATLGIVVTIVLIGVQGIPHALSRPLAAASFDLGSLLLPFGAILYALIGRTAIPTLVYYFRDEHGDVKRAKPAIIWGTVIPAALYAVFVIGVLGLSFPPSPDAVSGLWNVLPAWFMAGVGILGFLALWSSYFAIGRDLYEALVFDISIARVASACAVIAAPLLLYWAGLQDFITLVEIVGGIFIGLEGIFIIAMWRKLHAQRSEKAPALLSSVPLMVRVVMRAVFVVGIFYVLYAQVF